MSETYLSLWKGEIHRRSGEPCAGVVTFPRMWEILDETAFRHGVTVEALKGRERGKYLSEIRHEAIWRMRQVRWPDGTRRYSLPVIGKFMGRDHTSILNSERRFQQQLDRIVSTSGINSLPGSIIEEYSTAKRRASTGRLARSMAA